MAEIVELNVGGVVYSTSVETLTKDTSSLLYEKFNDKDKVKSAKDNKGRVFIDRDGVLFRYVLDYLRDLKLILPENFQEKARLYQEALYYRLDGLCSILKTTAVVNDEDVVTTCVPGFITVGYRGTFAFGREGLADVQFRKLSRIIVCGRVTLCREVFKDTLNESRDPDRCAGDRYTARYFLKHVYIEQAFDMLAEAGFKMVASCGSGTNSAGEQKAGTDVDEARWRHYNEFVFERR